MANISDQTLYEDQFQIVIQDDEREIITLIMVDRRVSLEFSFDERQDLRTIVSGIEYPDNIGN